MISNVFSSNSPPCALTHLPHYTDTAPQKAIFVLPDRFSSTASSSSCTENRPLFILFSLDRWSGLQLILNHKAILLWLNWPKAREVVQLTSHVTSTCGGSQVLAEQENLEALYVGQCSVCLWIGSWAKSEKPNSEKSFQWQVHLERGWVQGPELFRLGREMWLT